MHSTKKTIKWKKSRRIRNTHSRQQVNICLSLIAPRLIPGFGSVLCKDGERARPPSRCKTVADRRQVGQPAYPKTIGVTHAATLELHGRRCQIAHGSCPLDTALLKKIHLLTAHVHLRTSGRCSHSAEIVQYSRTICPRLISLHATWSMPVKPVPGSNLKDETLAKK